MTRPDCEESKAVWRRWAQGVRAALPLTLSARVVAHLRAAPEYRAARHVLSYLACGSEIDLRVLHEDEGKIFYVTRTPSTAAADLTVHRPDEPLEPHPYGYLQPRADAEQVDPQTIDLVLVPGLCFDGQGARLGYGKGYYDRLLPSLRLEVPRVGVTAKSLLVPRLPSTGFDVSMTHLVTELGVVVTKNTAVQ